MKTFVSLVIALVFTFFPSSYTREAKAQASQPHFQTHHDTIPNFVQNPTIRSVGNGSWFNANTWAPARLPNASDVVLISHAVTYDKTTGIADTIGIDANGVLRFATDQATKLQVSMLLVMPGGTLEVGTVANPVAANVTAEIIIRNKALDLTNDGIGVYDPEQWGTGLLIIDGRLKMHGSVKSPTFVRLARQPKAGDTTLLLEQAPEGWRPGDRLIVPDTRQVSWWPTSQYGTTIPPQWEELTIQSLSNSTVTLTSPVRYDHLGARDGDGILRFLPHIGNLTRNVLIRSANPNGTRGHTAWLHNADADVRYVQFQDLGRTTNALIDNTTLDANGIATHIGTNQIARYPFHTHHLSGPATPPANGFQTTAIGLAVDNGAHGDNIKWGMAIHGTHYGLFRQNVVYHVAGAGIVTEDSTESFNVIEQNFVVRLQGTGDRADGSCGISCAREGVGLWFRGPNNYVRDNVVANAVNSYGYTYYQFGTGTQRIPAYKGANPDHAGQFVEVDIYAMPLREFARNEVYGATPNGMTFWSVGIFGQDSPRATSRSVIEDFRAWHVRTGIYAYQSNKLTIAKSTFIGDPEAMRSLTSTGMEFGDYLQKDLVITEANIENFRSGIIVPLIVDERNQASAGITVIQNGFLRNYANVLIDTPLHNNNVVGLSPKRVELRNIKFAPMSVPPLSGITPYMISMNHQPQTISHLVQENSVYVYGYNQISGNDFRVYFIEQAPDFVVPKTTYRADGTPLMIASPEAGLTNQQNWQKHGIAIAGAVAPCSDKTSKPEIKGFVCSGGSVIDTVPPRAPSGLTVVVVP